MHDTLQKTGKCVACFLLIFSMLYPKSAQAAPQKAHGLFTVMRKSIGAQLTWQEVPGATSYRLYRYYNDKVALICQKNVLEFHDRFAPSYAVHYALEAYQGETLLIRQEASLGADNGVYILLTFDDGFKTDFSMVMPLLAKYSAVATSYIIPSRMGGPSRCMTWENTRALKTAGWAIGCHTYTHTSVTLLTLDALKDELIQSRAAFIKNGLPAPLVFSLPNSLSTASTLQMIYQHRKQVRTGGKGQYILTPLPYSSKEPLIAVNGDFLSQAEVDQKIALVEKAIKQKNTAIVFCAHSAIEAEPPYGSKYYCNVSYLEDFVAYCAQAGCRLINMEELMEVQSKYLKK